MYTESSMMMVHTSQCSWYVHNYVGHISEFNWLMGLKISPIVWLMSCLIGSMEMSNRITGTV